MHTAIHLISCVGRATQPHTPLPSPTVHTIALVYSASLTAMASPLTRPPEAPGGGQRLGAHCNSGATMLPNQKQ